MRSELRRVGHGRVSYGHGGAGDSGRAGDLWPKRLSRIAGKLVFPAPLWGAPGDRQGV